MPQALDAQPNPGPTYARGIAVAMTFSMHIACERITVVSDMLNAGGLCQNSRVNRILQQTDSGSKFFKLSCPI